MFIADIQMTEQTMTKKDTDQIRAVLSFWFKEISPENWFKKDAEFDHILKERFEPLIKAGLSGQLDRWAANADGRLALILLLDQMTRNIYRDSPAAFSGDEMALALSLRAQSDNMIASQKEMPKRQFFLMPMMHSEDLAIQKASLELFKAYTSEQTYAYAVRHHDVIARFGRFPHRNQILGRPSSEAEIAFLKEPHSSF